MNIAVPQVIRCRELAHSITRDCDCACPEIVPVKPQSRGKLQHEDFQLPTSLLSIPLSPGYRVVSVPTSEASAASIAVLNDSAWDALMSLGEDNEWSVPLAAWDGIWAPNIVDDLVIDFVELGYLTECRETKLEMSDAPTTLSAWLHITDRCNLRCSYCYFPHHRVDMSIETGRAAVDATFRSALQGGYKRVKLKYAGGEPLIRFAVVAELQRYAQAVADEMGIELEGVLLSNGTLLTERIVQEMQTLDLHMMISLDGLHGAHDRQRPFATGRGSSDVVQNAIDLALTWGLTPDISVTISGRNVDELPAVLQWILARDLPFGLNFYRENDLSATQDGLRLEEEGIMAGMLAAYKIIEDNLPRRSLLGSLIDRANLSAPHVRTCGVGHSYLVFDHQGHISKCQMAMHDRIASIDDLDPLALIRQSGNGVINLNVSQKEGCRDCEWQHWCTGGCPLATYRATGRYDVKSPFCNIYKALFPAAVRLEGLRLLRYHND